MDLLRLGHACEIQISERPHLVCVAVGQSMKHFEFCDRQHKPLLCMINDDRWFQENLPALTVWCERNGAVIHDHEPDMILMPDMATRTLFTLTWGE